MQYKLLLRPPVRRLLRFCIVANNLYLILPNRGVVNFNKILRC